MRRFVNHRGDIAQISRTRTKPYKWKVKFKFRGGCDLTVEGLEESDVGAVLNKHGDGIWIEKAI